MISKTKLDQLVNEFRSQQAGDSYEQQRADWWDDFTFEISPAWIDALTEDEALDLYKKTGWGVKLYQRTFQENGLDRIKASLHYLLYGSEPIEQRFFNFVDAKGTHKLGGVGREFASFLLCMHDNQQYGIWNTPVERGLRLLRMTPRRQRGEHIGQAYAKIVAMLKELQDLGDFADLQFTDEFLELLAKGLIGKDILEPGKQPPEPGDEEPEIPKDDTNQHLKIQWMLAKIGRWEGHDVWVATGDKNKTYLGESLCDLALDSLPHFSGPNVLDVAQHIDVIWFRANTATPVKFFEIEHSTSIFSGLLRMNDVRIDYPFQEAVIVAPQNRKTTFDNQIIRRTFNYSGLAESCQFWDYQHVEKLYHAEKIRQELLRSP